MLLLFFSYTNSAKLRLLGKIIIKIDFIKNDFNKIYFNKRRRLYVYWKRKRIACFGKRI